MDLNSSTNTNKLIPVDFSQLPVRNFSYMLIAILRCAHISDQTVVIDQLSSVFALYVYVALKNITKFVGKSVQLLELEIKKDWNDTYLRSQIRDMWYRTSYLTIREPIQEVARETVTRDTMMLLLGILKEAAAQQNIRGLPEKIYRRAWGNETRASSDRRKEMATILSSPSTVTKCHEPSAARAITSLLWGRSYSI